MPSKHSPHHYTGSPSLDCWHKAGWTIDSCCWHLILTRSPVCLSRNTTNQAIFSPSVQLSSFGDPTAVSALCFSLTEMEPVVVLCCCSTSTSKFEVCLLTTIIQIGCLSYISSSLSVSFNLSGHSMMISLINN